MSVNRKIFGLASSVLIFSGMAYGQALVCVTQPTVPVNSIELRLEGTTELVSDFVTACNGTATALVGNVSATISGVGNLPITSKSIGGGLTEATLQLIDNSGGDHATVTVSGVVSGSNVSFSPVTFPIYNFKMEISNVRVNASTSAANQPVYETFFAAAQGVALVQSNATPVGLVRQGLATPTISAVSNFLVCSSGGAAFTVTVGELFAGAFKLQNAPTIANQPILANDVPPIAIPAPPANIPGGEAGSYIPGGGSAVGTANSGTRIKFVFSAIPTNVTLSVPLTISSGTPTNLQVQLQGGTETGPFVAATSGTLTATGGVATAIYEVTTADLTSIKSFQLPVTATFTANSVTVPAGPITVTASLSPSPATVNGAIPTPIPTVPYFANTGTTLTGSGFAACQTTLLFPFVTNQQGFETGIAIANTGKDNLAAAGASQATGQAGACTITVYGSTGVEGGTAPAVPVAANFPSATNTPTTTIAPGTTHADTLTHFFGTGVQGYAIAVCPFLYARGFAFLEYNLLGNNGVVEGYLADVISSNRDAPLTFGTQVSNTSPEWSGQ